MPYKEREIEKVYFTIGEVADMLQLNASVLRYWEKEFDILRPKKNAKGDRFYTKEDISRLKLIHHLVREKGFTIEGARQRLKTHLGEEEKKVALLEKLKHLRNFLSDLKEQL